MRFFYVRGGVICDCPGYNIWAIPKILSICIMNIAGIDRHGAENASETGLALKVCW